MKSGTRNYGIVMLAAVAGLALSAAAQMSTPPAQKPESWPKETPVESGPTKHETISVEEAIRRGMINPDANKAPATSAQPAQPQPVQSKPEPVLSKDQMHANYDQWERDGTGHVIKLDRPLQWAALDRNKTITPATRKKIEAFIEQRRAKVEQTVLNNIEKVRELDSGEIETLSFSERGNVSKVLAASKPFTELGPVATELKKADLFTQNNVQQHQIIVDDYRRLMLDDMKRDAGATGTEKNNNTDFVARAMFLTMADEARQVYYWMLADSVNDAATRVSQLGVSAEVAPKVTDLFNQAKNTNDEAARITKMREAVALLTPEQTRQLLEPVVKPATASATPAAGSAPSNATSDASKAGDR